MADKMMKDELKMIEMRNSDELKTQKMMTMMMKMMWQRDDDDVAWSDRNY